MNTELLMQNLQLSLTVTIVGMVIVMVFLTLMVFTTDITKKIVDWLNVKFPVEVPVDTKQQKSNRAQKKKLLLQLLPCLRTNTKLKERLWNLFINL